MQSKVKQTGLSLPIALAVLLMLFLTLAMSSADLLQNPDFESPPTNMTANTTAPFLLQNKYNSIPGWSFNGTVWYVTSGPNTSLPGNGHAVQLGQDGKINQTFKSDNNYMNVLTFTLAPGSKNCSNNFTAVNVSSSEGYKVFHFQGRYGKEMWESHAYSFTSWDEGGLNNLVFQSTSSYTNSTQMCAPVVDTFLIRKLGAPIGYAENMLVNGGFEVGPTFLKNSSEGILLNDELDELQSSLQQWSVIGTVKYIDSRHYLVPEGRAAIEILSGAPSGLLTTHMLTKGSTYTLEFTMGDANDSCAGNFTVWIQAGMSIQNFTMISYGNGSVKNHSMTFKADSSVTPISLVSFNESQRSDHVVCGPVIDSVILRSFSGLRPKMQLGVLVLHLTVTIMQVLW